MFNYNYKDIKTLAIIIVEFATQQVSNGLRANLISVQITEKDYETFLKEQINSKLFLFKEDNIYDTNITCNTKLNEK